MWSERVGCEPLSVLVLHYYNVTVILKCYSVTLCDYYHAVKSCVVAKIQRFPLMARLLSLGLQTCCVNEKHVKSHVLSQAWKPLLMPASFASFRPDAPPCVHYQIACQLRNTWNDLWLLLIWITGTFPGPTYIHSRPSILMCLNLELWRHPARSLVRLQQRSSEAISKTPAREKHIHIQCHGHPPLPGVRDLIVLKLKYEYEVKFGLNSKTNYLNVLIILKHLKVSYLFAFQIDWWNQDIKLRVIS